MFSSETILILISQNLWHNSGSGFVTGFGSKLAKIFRIWFQTRIWIHNTGSNIFVIFNLYAA